MLREVMRVAVVYPIFQNIFKIYCKPGEQICWQFHQNRLNYDAKKHFKLHEQYLDVLLLKNYFYIVRTKSIHFN